MEWSYEDTLRRLEGYLDLKSGIRSDKRKVAQGIAQLLTREENAVEDAIWIEDAIRIFAAEDCDPNPVLPRNKWTASTLAKRAVA